ncbi:hypothetical protein JXQ70_15615 [bacterium]|nr:hypothetical protein [bacterium]
MDDIEKVIGNFAQVRILIIGDLMADKYVWGDGLHLSREAPIHVVSVVEETFSLGGAAHIARNARHLGGDVYLVGLVGYDDAAQSFRRAIANSGIDTGGIFPSSERPTTLKVRIMSTEFNQQLMRIDYESNKPLTKDEKASILKYVTSYINDIDVIVFADYEKGIFNDQTLITTILQLAQKQNVITVIHSKPGHFDMFNHASLIVTNYKNAQEFVNFKTKKPIYNVSEIGSEMITLMKCSALLIVQDDKGIYLFSQESESLFKKSITPEIFDINGVEDAIVSTIAISLAAGATMEEAVELASRAYKVIGSRQGSGVVSTRDLLL